MPHKELNPRQDLTSESCVRARTESNYRNIRQLDCPSALRALATCTSGTSASANGSLNGGTVTDAGGCTATGDGGAAARLKPPECSLGPRPRPTRSPASL